MKAKLYIDTITSKRELDQMFGSEREKFRRISSLMKQGNLIKALNELEAQEKSNSLANDDKFWSKLLKSQIFIQQGNAEMGLSLLEEILEDGSEFEDYLLELDGIVTKIEALRILNKLSWEDTKELDDYLNLIGHGEKILSEITTLNQTEIEIREACLKRNKGIIYRTQGELKISISCLQESLQIYEKLGDDLLINSTLDSLGATFENLGDNKKAIRYFQTKANLYEEIDQEVVLIRTYYWLFNFHFLQGELNLTQEYAKKGLDLSRKLKIDFSMIASLIYLGHVCYQRGELDNALEYYQESLKIIEKLGNKGVLAHLYLYRGIVHISKGENDIAFELYKEGLILAQETNDINALGWILYNLVMLTIDLNSIKLAEEYSKRLEVIAEKTKNRMISQMHRLANAELLKNSSRLKEKMKAQEIFQQVANEEIIWPELTIKSLVNLCDSMLFELKVTGEEKLLAEVDSLTMKLLNIAQFQMSPSILVETYLLQSKLALLKLDLEQAQQLLVQALNIAKEKGLGNLISLIKLERELFSTQLTKWGEIIENKPSMNDMIELTQLEGLIERMIDKRTYRKEEETLAYAEEARRLVEVWTRD